MKLSWIGVAERIEYELQQCEEEGSDVKQLRDEWRQVKSLKLSDDELQRRASTFYLKIENAHPPGMVFSGEPSSWTGISALCNIPTETPSHLPSSNKANRILGGMAWEKCRMPARETH